jgi:hypothetical protein
MKFVWPLGVHVIELFVVIFFGNVTPSHGLQNLLADPGFESGMFAASPYVGWGPVNAAAISQDYAHSGLWSLKDAYDSIGIGPVVAGTQIVAASPGLTYSLSAWALTPATLQNAQGLLLVDFEDNNQQLINYSGTVFYTLGTLDASSTANVWTFLSGSVTAPPGTAYIQALPELFNSLNSSPANVVYFDDLNLTQIPEPAGWALAVVGVCLIALQTLRRSAAPFQQDGHC